MCSISCRSTRIESPAGRRHELLLHGPNCNHKRYFPIVIDAVEYLDVFDASLVEILLAIVAEIAAELHKKEDISLKAGYFEKRWAEIKNLLFSDAEVKKIEIPLWKGKAEIRLKQADRKTRNEVRYHLEPQMPSLISEINTLLIDVRRRFAAHNPKDGGPKYDNIVLIVDNMERIRQVAGKSQGDESERALFVDGATQLNALRANIIYTVPLGLVRSIEPQLEALYGRKPFILPNVKTFTRENHLRFQPGRDKLIEMLLKRAKSQNIREVIDKDALDFLLDYCGGHVRQFMTFIRQTTRETKTTPIGIEAAEKAIQNSVTMYSTTIRTSQWPLLAQLERSVDKTWDSNDLDRRVLLENLCVLEYMNGGENESIFEAAEPWYAVHPIVRELRQFKSAVKDLQQTAKP